MSGEKFIEKMFKKYRTERLLKECPMCSDLWHGYKAGMLDQQSKIDALEKELKVQSKDNSYLNRRVKTLETQIGMYQKANNKIEVIQTVEGELEAIIDGVKISTGKFDIIDGKFEKFEKNCSTCALANLDRCPSFLQSKIEALEKQLDADEAIAKRNINENGELRAILKDFLATKECRETWIEEMRGTISSYFEGERQ